MNMHEVKVTCGDGKSIATFNVHKFSPLDGREIVAGYPLIILSKDSTYKGNVSAMRKLLKYCSVTVGEEEVHLVDDALINEHVSDWWVLVQLEYECLKFNCSFLEGTDLVSTVKASLTTMLQQFIADQMERLA